jgi:hypothetical protein
MVVFLVVLGFTLVAIGLALLVWGMRGIARRGIKLYNLPSVSTSAEDYYASAHSCAVCEEAVSAVRRVGIEVHPWEEEAIRRTCPYRKAHVSS